MSTEFKPVPAKTKADKPVGMTQFCGPKVGPYVDRTRMQFTVGDQWVTVSKSQAVAMVAAMTEWVAGEREEE